MFITIHHWSLCMLISTSQIGTHCRKISIIMVCICVNCCRGLGWRTAKGNEHCVRRLAHHHCAQSPLTSNPSIMAQFIDFVNVANYGHFQKGHKNEENGDKKEQIQGLKIIGKIWLSRRYWGKALWHRRHGANSEPHFPFDKLGHRPHWRKEEFGQGGHSDQSKNWSKKWKRTNMRANKPKTKFIYKGEHYLYLDYIIAIEPFEMESDFQLVKCPSTISP